MVEVPKPTPEPATVENIVRDFCDLIVCVIECHAAVRQEPLNDSRKVTLEHAVQVLKICLTRLLIAVGSID